MNDPRGNMARLPSAPAGSPWEIGWGVVTILMIASILPALMGGQPVGRVTETNVTSIQESGDALRQAVLLLLYGGHFLLLAWLVRPRALCMLGLPLLAFILWCLASSAWSPLPDPTLRRVVALLGTLAAGTFLGLRLGPSALVDALRISAAIAVLGSIAHAAVNPLLGFDNDGHMRGLFSHKNLFGSFLAVVILALIHRMTTGRGDRWGKFADKVLLLLCLVCLAAAHSATPILGLIAGVGVLFSVILATGGHSMVKAMAPALLGCGIAIILTFGDGLIVVVAEALGRDPSFSGRSTVWRFVIDAIGQRPWLGFGYGIFWLGEGAPGALFWYWSRQYELHAHNGYLQLLLDAGIIGLLIFLAALAVLIQRTIALVRAGHGEDGIIAWIAMTLGFFLACNLSESRILQGNDLLTLLFVWAMVRVNLEYWRLRVATSVARRIAWQVSRPGIAASPHPALNRAINLQEQ